MQFAREAKKAILRLMPGSARARFLDEHPNWRKAAPAQPEFVFRNYLGDLAVNIDTRYKVERIMWTGSYEQAFQHWIRKNVTPGSVCLDVGANVGAITLGLANAVGVTGRVVAIEPGPTNLQRLQRNLALNPSITERVRIERCGVSDRAGTLTWVEETENPGNAMLELSPLFNKQAKGDAVSVPVDTLDAIVQRLNPGRVAFIKIDVEGMELNVLQGASALLTRDRPTLFFETLDRYSRGDDGDKLAQIAELLAPLGYRFFKLDGQGEAHAVSPPPWPDYTLAVASPR